MRRITSCSRSVSRFNSSSDSAGAPRKASRTNPASRGLNTASPPATLRMASARSGPVTVLVTYPRAPARTTVMTSSAASETDSASTRTEGSRSAQSASTCGALPPGRWTSNSTTSGRVCLIASTADATSAASATTSMSAGSSARMPDLIRAWSSTITNRNVMAGPPPTATRCPRRRSPGPHDRSHGACVHGSTPKCHDGRPGSQPDRTRGRGRGRRDRPM